MFSFSARTAGKVLFTLLLCALPVSALGQASCAITWENPIRLSFDSVLSVSPKLATSGDTIHVIWYGIDTIGGISHSGVEYARSTDGGVSFSGALTIASGFDAFNRGVIACSGSIVCVAYDGVAGPDVGTVLVRSTDAGQTWDSPRLLRANSDPHLMSALDTSFYIQFADQATNKFGTLGSGDGGQTWTVRSTNAPLLSGIQAAADGLHGVGEYGFGSHPESGHYVSYDRGGVWFGPDPVSREDGVSSTLPQLSVSEDATIFVVWNDTGAVKMRRSAGFNEDDELIWDPELALSESEGAIFSEIAAAGPFVCVAWDVSFGGRAGLRFRPSNDRGESFCPADTPSVTDKATEPSLRFSGHRAHLAWAEDVAGSGEVFYRNGLLKEDPRPKSTALYQNYPNPFNGETHIRYDLEAPSHVSLQIYNTLGQRVLTLVDEYQNAAKYERVLPANSLPSGVYFYRLRTSFLSDVKKLIIVR